MTRPTLMYFGDPMCSWCYGFGPQLQSLHAAFGSELGLHVVVGGLRPYTTTPMNDSFREQLRHHWQEVAERSGRPFDYAILQRGDFIYDTEPACRAVVTARLLAPDSVLPYFLALQDAFYRDGRDVTAPDTLADVAVEFGLERQAFAEQFESETARRATRHNFMTAQNMRVQGFPTLLLHRDDQFWLVCRGYTEAAPLADAIRRQLAD